ncbi:MAG TPA: metallophosphoesterase [Phycisphaerae bacterium]|nr:metallophosphoesterase [Phycisphaerae bacterium]
MTDHLLNPLKLTRRSFLAMCLAGCSLAARRPQWPESPEHVWALVSDTHISGLLDRSVRGSNMADNLAHVVEDIASAAPSQVLFNGDLAYARGEEADYAAFRRLVSPLWDSATPVHLAVGNHDNRAGLLEAFSVATDPNVADKAVSAVSVGGVDWLFLDSLEQGTLIRGSLGPQQLAWLARELDSSTAPAIVCLHHNPETSSLVGLKDAQELIDIVLPRRRVKVLFFGHTHVFRIWQDDGLHFVNLPATGYRFFSPDVPLGWVRACMRINAMRLEFRGLTSRERGHGSLHDLSWRSDV